MSDVPSDPSQRPAWLQSLLTRHALSPREAARILGLVEPRRMYRWLAGSRELPVDAGQRLAQILELRNPKRLDPG